MPELPEVEVTKRGISQSLLHAKIKDVYFDDKSLRKPFSKDLYNLIGSTVTDISRRAKYIIVETTKGYLLIHLGMSGHLSILPEDSPRLKHDHFDITTEDGSVIRLNDTRRFGLVLYFALDNPPQINEPLKSLGPEPFSDEFNSDYLFKRLSHVTKSIKQALMDNAIVVGVGNIYASEILFACKISPTRKANNVTVDECTLLVKNIVDVLHASIERGGTTLRDFYGADGKPGYYVQDLSVYGHSGKPCRICGHTIESIVQGQRTTYYCPNCQK